MSRLLDKLRGAQRAREETGILFVALKKAHAEREASRQAGELIAQASDEAAQAEIAPAIEPLAPAREDAAPPKRNDTHTAAVIAMLIVAAALCAAVAWRGSVDIAPPPVMKIDQGLDLKRIQPQRGQAEREPPAAKDGK